MYTPRTFTCRLFLAANLALATACAPAWAQLKVGMTSGFTGAVSSGANENLAGAKLYIDHINATGGVAGQKIEIVTLDDKFETALAAENARKLIEEHNVIALFLNRGTPHTEAILPVVDAAGVALVAPSTGAMVLHEPISRHVFNVRATYQEEAALAVRHLITLSLTRIAVVHVDDSFGRDGAQGALRGFTSLKKEPLFIEKFERTKPDLSKAVMRAIDSKAQAVLVVASAQTTSDMTRALRQAGSAIQVVTLSNNASSGFVKLLGEHARGVMVSQVFPGERRQGNTFINQAMRLAKAQNQALSPAMLEGYAAAQVMVEALRRSGKNPSREKLLKALDNFAEFDLGGGLKVGYSATDHTGLRYAEMSIIGADGQFKR